MPSKNRPRTLKQMAARAGFTSRNTSRHVTAKNFPVDPARFSAVGAQVFSLGRTTEPEIFAEMERRGLRPATIEELLAFCARHRGRLPLPNKHVIAALGTAFMLGGVERAVICVLAENGRPHLAPWDAVPGRTWFERTSYLGMPKSAPRK